MSRPTLARGSALAVAALLAMSLSACASAVSLEPAQDAVDPGCADIIVSLPQNLPNDAETQQLRETNAQATAAWGTPASILLRCGITPPGPTTDQCININGIDWIIDDTKAPSYRFVTYGRTPATEVIVDSKAVSSTSVLVDLGASISKIRQSNKCLDADDTLTIPTNAP